MKRGTWKRYRQPILWVSCLLFVVLVYFTRALPDDTVRVMTVGGRFNRLNRHVISPKSTDHGISLKRSSLPCSVSFQSSGPKLRVYLLDLLPIKDSMEKVKAFMTASEEIERGAHPSTSALVQEAVNVTEGKFSLASMPWNWNADYLLIVYAEVEAQVTVRVSYGK